MDREAFEKIVEEEAPHAVPAKFHNLIHNVAFLIEDEPDEATRKEHGLEAEETLLGLYRGVPHPVRGDHYGVGATLPDTITLYRLPLEEEAIMLAAKFGVSEEEAMRRAVRETVWHEVAHYFGMDEHQVREREEARDHEEGCESCGA